MFHIFSLSEIIVYFTSLYPHFVLNIIQSVIFIIKLIILLLLNVR